MGETTSFYFFETSFQFLSSTSLKLFLVLCIHSHLRVCLLDSYISGGSGVLFSRMKIVNCALFVESFLLDVWFVCVYKTEGRPCLGNYGDIEAPATTHT